MCDTCCYLCNVDKIFIPFFKPFEVVGDVEHLSKIMHQLFCIRTSEMANDTGSYSSTIFGRLKVLHSDCKQKHQTLC